MKYLHIHLLSALVVWIGLYLDGKAVAFRVENTQIWSSVLVIITFFWIVKSVSKPVRELMFFGLIVAVGGEVLFSLVLGMYTYRLENLPLYVPFGHSIIYASIYYLVKEPLVRNHKEKIIKLLYIAMILYSTLWLFYGDDTFGFLCMLVIVILFKRHPDTKLFFLLMYFAIVYLELLGTYYGCWSWPEIWFDKITFIESANPPSGISVFYFAFDVGCLWFYKHYNKRRWYTMKRMREYRVNKPRV